MTRAARDLLDGFSRFGAVDTACFLGQWPYRLHAAADADDLRGHAARHGLTGVWVSHLAALFGFDTRTGNEVCWGACAGDAVLHPFAVLDPRDGAWREELAWAADTGFAGIRVAPGFHGCRAVDAGALIDACAAAGLPLQLIVRLDDARSRHPMSSSRELELRDIADLIRSAPPHPLVISGLNRAEYGEVARHLADDVPAWVRFDLWHVNGPLGVAKLLGEDPGRWVFGSGFPVQEPVPTALQLAASGLDDAALAAITRGNAEQMPLRRGPTR
ncbi:hypothetical protein BOH66_02985 [Microbacterium aurum]|uniref:Uncharacterized protein n=1 Tax=Microbacterium aurum TaxID=36805 RepID=A0A1P8U5J1_9MICO|nr:amidohydrolase family protein [Microbacterium aurum]APZ33357.1 hypothetical protein BOH66_02985 [Microbacterium aurum]MBM7827004.1 putative TIM-barrel fold metal-dependent hydrolase [Microbacterium aurum]